MVGYTKNKLFQTKESELQPAGLILLLFSLKTIKLNHITKKVRQSAGLILLLFSLKKLPNHVTPRIL
jgi:hypothetical protein